MSMHEHRDSKEIREHIEDTRARMDATIDELEARLSPRELADHAWSYVRDHGRGVGDALRDHPVPLSLMGLGVAWLAAEEAGVSLRGNGTNGRADYVGSKARAEGRVGPYRGDALSDEDDSTLDKVRDAAASAKHGAEHAAHAARHGAHEAGERLHDAAHRAGEAGHRAREGAADAADAVRQRTGEIADGLQSWFRDSPLALGALSFGIGLAAALSGPSTRVEDRVMGETADALKDRAKRAAGDLGERAAHVAADTAEAAAVEARRQSEGLADEVKERARRVADEAGETARRSTREQEHRS